MTEAVSLIAGRWAPTPGALHDFKWKAIDVNGGDILFELGPRCKTCTSVCTRRATSRCPASSGGARSCSRCFSGKSGSRSGSTSSRASCRCCGAVGSTPTTRTNAWALLIGQRRPPTPQLALLLPSELPRRTHSGSRPQALRLVLTSAPLGVSRCSGRRGAMPLYLVVIARRLSGFVRGGVCATGRFGKPPHESIGLRAFSEASAWALSCQP